MLSSALSLFDRLYVTGGLTGTKDAPVAVSKIQVWEESTRTWTFWGNMAEGRLNHSATSYGPFMVVSGGHGLVNGVPTCVSSAITYHVLESSPEHYTPILGTQRIGAGVAVIGDPSSIDKILKSQRQ
ncbi:UNVERIFIED_CONTAM: hypothetical protein RMT77_004009 [Armadillidium vulgare]